MCYWTGAASVPVAWWCALGGLVVGWAAAIAWIWSTRVPLDRLGDHPNGMLSVIPEIQALAWRVAGWRPYDRAGSAPAWRSR
ncbi:hypothetical protein [Burkholderia stagnalis]|uniref:hypothetical protein n=1 Tax=Burkholderia stagnalis TaxID=1503054 RepID=UPI000757E6F4|nr:hypothetical protein [Burkholderia stagnalis]KVL93095.1 hypothetical protein WT03_19005 [Burkholderia stagnalis]KVL94792.1 hypothetical protein WT02_18175 [Burkholderia stagnalis]KVM13125.1 hypothetical protein WT04_11495 [Burkholderia stagnalis]